MSRARAGTARERTVRGTPTSGRRPILPAMPQPAGYSGTPLAKKLGIKPGAMVLAIDAPPDLPELLDPLPDDASLAAVLEDDRDGLRTGDPILVFGTEAAVLATRLETLRDALHPDRAAWICWPKKASKVPTDITEDVIRELALPIGLVDVKVCAIDATWSGLRLVIRKELR